MFDGLKPHVGGPVLPPGKITVFIGGMPASTITDRCFCVSAPDIIVQGAQTVLINGLMAARMGDATAHGGRIVIGCPTVLIGGPTFTTPSFFAKFFNVFLDNLEFGAGLVVGFVGGVINTVEGLINVLLHPIETIKSIFKLAESILFTLSKKETWIALTKKETWVKIKNDLGQIYDDFEKASPYEKGKVVGKATEFIAELLLVPEAKVAVAGEAVEAAKFAEAVKGAAGVGEIAKTAGKLEEIVPLLKTEPDTAFFWSGRSNGIGGAEKAMEIAGPKGGTTLEGLIDAKGIEMPAWDINDPASIKAWQNVSAEYAKQVSGEVRAVVGSQLREANVWENIELPNLKANSAVTKITTIDPVTLEEKVIFQR